jgi:hypothetical protein
MVPYEGCKIYGPNKCTKDGRMSVRITYPKGTKITISYPRYLMELHLEQYLLEDEHVHHINGDHTDNRLENLQVLKITDHLAKHNRKSIVEHVSTPMEFLCPTCKILFTLSPKQVNNLLRRMETGKNKTGPYCSIECGRVRGRSTISIRGAYLLP